MKNSSSSSSLSFLLSSSCIRRHRRSSVVSSSLLSLSSSSQVLLFNNKTTTTGNVINTSTRCGYYSSSSSSSSSVVMLNSRNRRRQQHRFLSVVVPGSHQRQQKQQQPPLFQQQHLKNDHYVDHHHSTIRTLASRTNRYYHQSSRHSQQQHHQETTTTKTNNNKNRGLFSIPELQNPSDFAKMSKQAIEKCNNLRSSLGADGTAGAGVVVSSRSQALDILYRLDEISQCVCNVIDAAELARSVHCNEQWRDSANRAFSVLADYITQLNSDRNLYQSLMAVNEYIDDDHNSNSNSSSHNFLTEEEVRFARLLKAEFERDGIHLPFDEKEREKLRKVQNQITDLEGLFQNNLMKASNNKFNVSDDNKQSVLDVLPEHVLQAYGASINNNDSSIDLPTDVQIMQSLIKYSPDSDLRKQVYVESTTLVPENLDVLDALRRKRHELAHGILQFDSYADRFLRDKMALNQSNVHEFLNALHVKTKPTYREEMNLLLQAKQSIENGTTTTTTSSSSSSSCTIEPWDIPFYVGLLKAHNGFDINTISQYLTIDNCLGGMKTLVDKLFGIAMKEVTMTNDERWDGIESESSGIDGNGIGGIRRFDFYDTTEGKSLGTMYLDLHPRPGKYGHAAHFTVRCGCVTNGLLRKQDESPEYQLPTVALVCNLSSSTMGSSSPSVLAHSEVETLFHEFGHALHSLLSRTEFQHMSGTRAAMDFVETPSHLMENFVWDPTFLKVLCVHQATGEVIPDETIHQLRKSRYEFHSIERMNQIIYALFDQKLFGVPPTSNGKSTTEMFAELHRQYEVPYVDGTHWHSRFGHLVTYGAGYYGYLYSQVFASDIWQGVLSNNSLSRAAGDKLWHKMLIHGGARDPATILTDLLGRPPEVVGS